MAHELVIGTRGSLLATTQAGHIRDDLIAGGNPAHLHIVTTAGDINMAPVERIGVGVFTQALREAMAAGEVNVAVHSMKDLPTAPDPRFHLVVPKREDPREALIARDGLTFADLPEGARVGTSAPRRISQLRAHRPDLDIQPLRGNIDTRMGRVDNGELDAIILAYAGISRVEKNTRATYVFDPTELMPAPAQGALAVECRVEDAEIVAALNRIACPESTDRAHAERAVLRTLEAGCTAPVAAYSTVSGDQVTIHGGVFALDGSAQLVDSITGSRSRAVELGRELGQHLISQGAASIINR